MQRKFNSKSRHNNKNKYDTSGSLLDLGTFMHKCANFYIIKLSDIDIPYPNAFIYNKNKQQIGKVEEIFGRQNDVHVAVKIEKDSNEFFIYSNKLIPRNRFLERSDVEKKKEANDKKHKNIKKEKFKQENKYKFQNDSYDKKRKFVRNGKFGGDKNKKKGRNY